MGETYGVPLGVIPEGVKYGVRKVNIDIELILIHKKFVRKF